MKDIILDVLEQSGTLSMQAIALHIIVAACLGVVIYISYWYTHTGTAYSKKIQCVINYANNFDRNRYDCYW